jgi:hypothetical protein
MRKAIHPPEAITCRPRVFSMEYLGGWNMMFRLLCLSALLAVGCASPKAATRDYGGSEGWPPAVSSIVPTAGQAGSVVTLNGDYLGDAKQVLIGGESATFKTNSKSLTVTVPADLLPGPAKVVVVVPRGTTTPVTFSVVR